MCPNPSPPLISVNRWVIYLCICEPSERRCCSSRCWWCPFRWAEADAGCTSAAGCLNFRRCCSCGRRRWRRGWRRKRPTPSRPRTWAASDRSRPQERRLARSPCRRDQKVGAFYRSKNILSLVQCSLSLITTNCVTFSCMDREAVKSHLDNLVT